MEMIEETDISDALEKVPTKTIDGLADMAIEEMHHRFETPETRAKIPDHALFKLIGDINKILERRSNEAPEKEPELLELIDMPGYPVGSKRRLLDEEIARLEAQAGALRLRREELQ